MKMFLLKNFFPFFLIFYLLMATVGWRLNGGNEVFPFFHWSLFTNVPNYISLPRITIEGQDVVYGDLRKPQAVKAWFESVMEDSETVFENQSIIERDFVVDKVSYELIYEEYFPKEGWYDHQYEKQLSLGVYKDFDLLWDKSKQFHPNIKDSLLLDNYDISNTSRESISQIAYKGPNYTAIKGIIYSNKGDAGLLEVLVFYRSNLIARSDFGYPVAVGDRKIKKNKKGQMGFFLPIPVLAENMDEGEVAIFARMETGELLKLDYENK